MSKAKKWTEIVMDDISVGDTIKYVNKFLGSKIIREGVVTQLVGVYAVEIECGGQKMYIDSKEGRGSKVTLYKKRFVGPTGLGAVVRCVEVDDEYLYFLVHIDEDGFRSWYNTEIGMLNDADLDMDNGVWTTLSKGVKL